MGKREKVMCMIPLLRFDERREEGEKRERASDIGCRMRQSESLWVGGCGWVATVACVGEETLFLVAISGTVEISKGGGGLEDTREE